MSATDIQAAQRHPHFFRRTLRLQRHQVAEMGLLDRAAAAITRAVGTMWCAIVFAVLAVLGFPTGGSVTVHDYVSWVSQTFIQLVMLSIIMVGQRILGAAADQQAADTYRDVEAILAELTAVRQQLTEMQTGRGANITIHAAGPTH